MQDGKRITLKNKFLINFRSNIRYLIKEAYTNRRTETSREVKKIFALMEDEDNIENEELNNNLSNLMQEENALDDTYKRSILKCGLCNTLEGDRIYYKRFDKWFCPDCYKENIKGWGHSDWEPRYPLSKNQVIKFLEELDKVVGQCQTNFDLSKEILTGMDISKSDQKIFLDTLYHYGGHCDCEIMLNAVPNVIADLDIDME